MTSYQRELQARMRAVAGLPPIQTATVAPDPNRIINQALAAPRPNPINPPCEEDTP